MTSIEWLIKQIKNDHNEKCLTGIEWIKIFEQAKEMHKKDIIDAYDKGEFDCGCNGSAEQYYNKLFTKN